jgi:CBS domain-containing protein
MVRGLLIFTLKPLKGVKMRVRDIMNPSVEFVAPNAAVSTAAKIMRDRDIGVLPVVDENNVIGMITDRDLAVRVLADKLSPDTIVEDIMTAELLSCSPEDTVEAAADLMAERQVHRLVVINEDRSPVGIVSLADLALRQNRAAEEAMSGIAEKRHDEPGRELNH